MSEGEQQPTSSGSAPANNPNHRPLVGGFAAAAYEAARAHHLAQQEAKKRAQAQAAAQRK